MPPTVTRGVVTVSAKGMLEGAATPVATTGLVAPRPSPYPTTTLLILASFVAETSLLPSVISPGPLPEAFCVKSAGEAAVKVIENGAEVTDPYDTTRFDAPNGAPTGNSILICDAAAKLT